MKSPAKSPRPSKHRSIESHPLRVIGLMSGTSMDGIDAALIETDGESRLTLGAHASIRYPPGLREMLLRLPLPGVDMTTLEHEVTDLHSQAVETLCAAGNIDL